MRLINADELVEHAWRDKLDSREKIVEMIQNAPTVKEIPTKIPLEIWDALTTTKFKWIPCSKHLPEDHRPVIITWKNNDPPSYYQGITGKHFIGVAHYKNGKWYWYSSVTEDMLAEYGKYESEELDDAIEVIAWGELPNPYKRDE